MDKIQRTAECVTPMHPDKMCDRISDAILDYCLEQDPDARVAIETMGGHGRVYITGEITTKRLDPFAREQVVEDIVHGITGKHELISLNIVEQSPEIAQGVDTGGAGDQGIMRGYACRENPEMMPQEYYLARSLCKFLFEKFPYDGKTQVTIDQDGKPEKIVASFMNVSSFDLQTEVNRWLIETFPERIDPVIFANPAGDWNIGGFDADTGLTGRKLMVDNYGPRVAIGGGAFSGKDATKVDRSAAYMARKVAIDYLNKNPEAKEVAVELAYAIGVVEPVSAIVTIDGQTERIPRAYENTQGYDLTPKGIITQLNLKAPQYAKTAEWGHFGNGNEWDK